MREDRVPPAIPNRSPPIGPPRYAWFSGVVEGSRGSNDGPLHAVSSRIEQLGLGRTDLELDGPRFSLLLTGETIRGDRLDDACKQSFLGALEELVRVVGDDRPIESTLRCTEVHSDQAVDTLFGIQDGVVRPLSRMRPLEGEDLRHAPPDPAAVPELDQLGRRRALVILAIVFVLGGLAVWQSGIIERLASADPTQFDLLTTEFGERIAVTVEQSFGSYVVEIRRGPTFPDDDEKLAQWQGKLSGARDRRAYQTLAAGGEVYVHLLGEESQQLEMASVDLLPIVVGTSEVVIVRIPGRHDATGIAVSPVGAWGR